jgi:aspartate beta-hydroxylase
LSLIVADVWLTCGRLTVHLGLRVPRGCSLRVAEETRAWEEGKCLVFDDSFEHEVGWFNRSILIIIK